jgi:hypothetical protein
MSDPPDLPGDVTVRETVDGVEVSASRKVQLDQYEPIETYVGLNATKPGEMDEETFDQWVEALSELAMQEAERAAMQRHEQYVREEAFGDD